MSSEQGSTKPPAMEELEKELPSWRRIGEFIRNILRLERSVEALRTENKELDQRVSALQRQLDEQTGKLKVLTDFVSKALDERIEARAEEASIRAFERMASISGLKAGKKRRRKDKTQR